MKKLFDLLKTAKSSESLWEEQAAAMEFVQKYGQALLEVAVTAKHVKKCDLNGRYHEMEWAMTEMYNALENLEEIDA